MAPRLTGDAYLRSIGAKRLAGVNPLTPDEKPEKDDDAQSPVAGLTALKMPRAVKL